MYQIYTDTLGCVVMLSITTDPKTIPKSATKVRTVRASDYRKAFIKYIQL